MTIAITCLEDGTPTASATGPDRPIDGVTQAAIAYQITKSGNTLSITAAGSAATGASGGPVIKVGPVSVNWPGGLQDSEQMGTFVWKCDCSK